MATYCTRRPLAASPSVESNLTDIECGSVPPHWSHNEGHSGWRIDQIAGNSTQA